jgi:hypothetical protein
MPFHRREHCKIYEIQVHLLFSALQCFEFYDLLLASFHHRNHATIKKKKESPKILVTYTFTPPASLGLYGLLKKQYVLHYL